MLKTTTHRLQGGGIGTLTLTERKGRWSLTLDHEKNGKRVAVIARANMTEAVAKTLHTRTLNHLGFSSIIEGAT